MTDRLATGFARLSARRRAHMTRSVTYVRGDDSVELVATPGRTIFRYDDRHGRNVRKEMRDFIITAADLVLGGSAVEPEAGDRIQEAVGDETWTYEVLDPNADEPAWRYTDSRHTQFRIHTVRVDVEAA